jgi:MoxR-like ATPase
MTPTDFARAMGPVQAVRNHLRGQFFERASVIDGSLAAMLARQNVMLLGLPGTAKSAVVRAAAAAFSGKYFEMLLTKFSTPEELFGPVSLKGLENDEYRRVTTSMLPEAEVAFIDETFRGNSAILNAMLTLANERTFRNAGQPTKTPLVSLFGAANDLPDGRDLEAFFDRFLIRFDVRYLVDDNNFRSMLTAGDVQPGPQYTMDDLRAAQAAVKTVKVTDATVDAIVDIRRALAADGIVVSDRRWKQVIPVLQAYCALLGQQATSSEDLTVLTDMLWREPKDRARIARTVGRLADPVAFQVSEILDAAREAAQKVHALRTSQRDNFLNEAKRVLAEFRDQELKLAGLASQAGPRARQAVQDGQAEIKSMHADLSRELARGLGLGIGRTQAA